MIKFVIKYFKLYKKSFILCILVTLSLTAITIINPFFLGKLIDVFTIDSSINDKLVSLRFITIILICLFILSLVLSYLVSYLSEVLKYKIYYSILNDIIHYIQKISFTTIKQRNTTELIQQLDSDVFNMVTFFMQHCVNLIVNIIIMLVIILFVFKISLQIALFIICALPIYGVIYFCLKDKLFNTVLSLKRYQNSFYSSLYKQIDNLKFIKINVLYKFLEKDFNCKFVELLKGLKKYVTYQFLFNGIGKSLCSFMNIIIIIIGGFQIIHGSLTIGMFSILSAYTSYLLDSLTYILSFSNEYQNCKASYSRIYSITKNQIQNNGDVIIDNINDIKIKQLQFSFADGNYYDKISSFNFKKNNIYLLKGNNGKGKSTLINLIVGLYDNYKGVIEYNGVNINDIDLIYLRQNYISVVEQEPFILEDNLINNIRFDNNKIEIKDIRHYCLLFGIEKLLNNNSLSIDNLSSGQKQKIAIIRSFVSKKDVLIFDEPTSSLDFKSFDVFVQELEKFKKDRIIIIITHDEKLDCIDNVTVTL